MHSPIRKTVARPESSEQERQRRTRSRSRLSVGTPLVLVPDPDNAYDRNAVLIYRADYRTEAVGYSDATGAKQIGGILTCLFPPSNAPLQFPGQPF